MTLDPRHAVAEFMTTFGQPVRSVPTTDITDAERVLRARIGLEEMIEFVLAMGCTIRTPDGAEVTKDVIVDINPNAQIDLVEAADAIADITVVTEGSAHTLGINSAAIFDLVHRSNMAKAPGGVVLRRESDGKIIKPEGWTPPTEAIAAAIATAQSAA